MSNWRNDKKLEWKKKKKNKNKNKFQDVLDKINANPFAYFFKPIDNIKDFPNKVVIGLEKLLESPFDENNKPWYETNSQLLNVKPRPAGFFVYRVSCQSFFHEKSETKLVAGWESFFAHFWYEGSSVYIPILYIILSDWKNEKIKTP